MGAGCGEDKSDILRKKSKGAGEGEKERKINGM